MPTLKCGGLREDWQSSGDSVSFVIINFNGGWLALSPEDLQEALRCGHELVGEAYDLQSHIGLPERVLDAKGMEVETGIPESWFLEHARQGDIPHIRAGKYVRFKLGEVLEALKVPTRHADRLSFGNGKRLVEQEDTNGCYHVATTKKSA